MKINYADFFTALGYTNIPYDAARNKFDSEEITDSIREIQSRWRDKYPNMDFKTQNLRFDTLVNFDMTFTNEIEFLNMDT